MRRFHTMLLLTAAALLVMAGMAVEPAAACSCVAQRNLRVLWPIGEAADVPIDTPIVFKRSNLVGDMEDLQVELLDDAGEAVELREVKVLPAPYFGCGGYDTVFLAPAQPLMPNAHYEVVGSDVTSADGGLATVIAFDTGEHVRKAPADPEIDITYVRSGPRECKDRGCMRRAELAVRFDAQSDPFWITLASKAAEHNRNTAERAAGALYRGQDDVLSVDLPDSGDCTDIAIYDVTGRTILEKSLCKPAACVDLESWRGSACEEAESSGFDPTKVGPGSCDHPPLLEYETGKGFLYPANAAAKADGRAEADDDSGDGSGCAVVEGAWLRHRGGVVMVMAILALALRRRRALGRFRANAKHSAKESRLGILCLLALGVGGCPADKERSAEDAALGSIDGSTSADAAIEPEACDKLEGRVLQACATVDGSYPEKPVQVSGVVKDVQMGSWFCVGLGGRFGLRSAGPLWRFRIDDGPRQVWVGASLPGVDPVVAVGDEVTVAYESSGGSTAPARGMLSIRRQTDDMLLWLSAASSTEHLDLPEGITVRNAEAACTVHDACGDFKKDGFVVSDGSLHQTVAYGAAAELAQYQVFHGSNEIGIESTGQPCLDSTNAGATVAVVRDAVD